MSNKVNSPCLKCKDRHFGCHQKCEKYAEFKLKRALENKLISDHRRSNYEAKRSHRGTTHAKTIFEKDNTR